MTKKDEDEEEDENDEIEGRRWSYNPTGSLTI